MNRYALTVTALLTITLGTLVAPGQADIISIAGRTGAQVDEFRFGEAGQTDRASDSYPETSATLPLQVIAQLSSASADEPAAAAAAAQFADPTELDQPNPEQFAINLTLNSVSDDIYYTAHALSQETRGVLFSAGELGAFSDDGDTEELTGRLFLDGALTILAVESGKDLTGATVLLRVTVVRQVEGQDDDTVFSGVLELSGTTGGNVTVAAEGAFPTDQLILTDLATLAEDFAAFSVLIIPSITIDYEYSAVVGQPFTLQATVEVEATNVAGESGVAAVIGAPTDTLTQVIGLTQNQTVAAKVTNAISSERENPTGEFAFPRTHPLFPLCGLFGLEGLIGIAALVGLKCFGMPGTYGRK